MNSDDTAIEFERWIARAQSSLNRHDAQEFRAAIKELERLAGENGRWQSAVNFLARSIDSTPTATTLPTRPATHRE
jgi:hypothetical protein